MKWILASCAVAALAGSAGADTVDLTYAGRGLGWGHKVILDGVSTNYVFTGELMHTFANGTGSMSGMNGLTVPTFALELEQQLCSLGTCYDATDPAGLPLAGGMGTDRARALNNVFSYASTINPTDTFDAKNLAAALQFIIWEIVYETDATPEGQGVGIIDITSGRLSATQTRDDRALSSGIMRHFVALRDNGIGFAGFGSIMGLGSPGFQDQVVTVVPLPSAVGMGLVSLGLLATRRRR